jgi:hypothetical protein
MAARNGRSGLTILRLSNERGTLNDRSGSKTATRVEFSGQNENWLVHGTINRISGVGAAMITHAYPTSIHTWDLVCVKRPS